MHAWCCALREDLEEFRNSGEGAGVFEEQALGGYFAVPFGESEGVIGPGKEVEGALCGDVSSELEIGRGANEWV